VAARKNHNKPDPIASAKQKQIDDRVNRARMSSPPRDASYYEKCGDLAQRLGIDPSIVFEEFDERAGVREWCGNTSRAESESLAWLDVQERFERQRRIA